MARTVTRKSEPTPTAVAIERAIESEPVGIKVRNLASLTEVTPFASLARFNVLPEDLIEFAKNHDNTYDLYRYSFGLSCAARELGWPISVPLSEVMALWVRVPEVLTDEFAEAWAYLSEPRSAYRGCLMAALKYWLDEEIRHNWGTETALKEVLRIPSATRIRVHSVARRLVDNPKAVVELNREFKRASVRETEYGYRAIPVGPDRSVVCYQTGRNLERSDFFALGYGNGLSMTTHWVWFTASTDPSRLNDIRTDVWYEFDVGPLNVKLLDCTKEDSARIVSPGSFFSSESLGWKDAQDASFRDWLEGKMCLADGSVLGRYRDGTILIANTPVVIGRPVGPEDIVAIGRWVVPTVHQHSGNHFLYECAIDEKGDNDFVLSLLVKEPRRVSFIRSDL